MGYLMAFIVHLVLAPTSPANLLCHAALQALSGTTAEKTEKANIRVLEFILRNKRIPQGNDWKDLRINRSQWNGTGQYKTGGSHAAFRFHSSSLEAWNAQKRLFSVMDKTKFTPDDIKTIERIIDGQIFSELPHSEQVAQIDDRILDYFIADQETYLPYTGVWSLYGLSYHQWAAVGHYAEGEKYRDKRYHTNALEGWSQLEEKLRRRPVSPPLTEKLKAMLLGEIAVHKENNSPAIPKKSNEPRPIKIEVSLDERIRTANARLAQWVKENKRIFTWDDVRKIVDPKINPEQWSGTGLYRFKMGARASQAFHRHISDAFRAILVEVERFEISDDPTQTAHMTSAEKKRIIDELKQRIERSKKGRNEKITEATQTVADYYWTHERRPPKSNLQRKSSESSRIGQNMDRKDAFTRRQIGDRSRKSS